MVRFGLTTDSHYADRVKYNLRHYQESIKKMQAFIDVMNNSNVDFIIHLGDFKDEGLSKKEEDTLKYLDKLEAIYSQFKGPKYHCVGNHDLDSITKSTFLSRITNTGISKNHSYYSFETGGYHFVVLDANYTKEGRDHFMKEDERSWERPYIPKEEQDWLAEDLKKSSLPVIIFCHHPLYEVRYKRYNMYVLNYEEVQMIINQSGKVKVALHGHVHEERYACINGVHYYTSKAMVDHPYPANAFSLVTLDKHSMNIQGFSQSSSQRFILQ